MENVYKWNMQIALLLHNIEILDVTSLYFLNSLIEAPQNGPWSVLKKSVKIYLTSQAGGAEWLRALYSIFDAI